MTALDLASWGIAETLIEEGRTAHSAFKISLNVRSIEQPHDK